MITFELTERAKDGADVAAVEWGGRTFQASSTRSSTTQTLARELVEAGAEDQPWMAVLLLVCRIRR